MRGERRRRRVCGHQVRHEGAHDVRPGDLGHPQGAGHPPPHGQHQVQGQDRRQPRRHRHPRHVQRGAGGGHPRGGQAVPGGRPHLQDDLCPGRVRRVHAEHEPVQGHQGRVRQGDLRAAVCLHCQEDQQRHLQARGEQGQ